MLPSIKTMSAHPARINAVEMYILISVLTAYMRVRERCHALQKREQQQQFQTHKPINNHVFNINIISYSFLHQQADAGEPQHEH